jgi:signal transduction histidine kinase
LISTIVYVTASHQINLNSLVSQRTTELEERSKTLTEEVGIRKISQRKLFEANRQLEDSLREVNCLLEVSQLQLEGKTRLEDVLIKASEILDRSILIQKKMSSRIRVNKGEHMAYPSDGRFVYGSKIQAKGKVTGYIEVLQHEDSEIMRLDETEKKMVDSVATIIGMIQARWRAERREEDAKKEAQFYLDLMSHDINNLHQGILVNLQLIEKGMIIGPMINKVVGNSADLVRRSINLVRNVKLLSVMKDYEKPLTTIDLGSSLNEAANEVKLAFPKRDVEISIKLPGDTIKILADKVVEEVFINIMNNAVKVQEKDPALVEIGARIVKEKVLLSISDHGPGINDNDKGRLFERHDNRIKDKSLSGLGLSLVKVLMDRYGGRVWISDRIEGDHTRGARFNLIFKRLNPQKIERNSS